MTKDSRALREEIENARAAVMDDARHESVKKRHSRGQPTAREYIDMLCDPGTFDENGVLVQPARDAEDDAALVAPADGMIVGMARLEGRPVAVTANDAMTLGGSSGKVGMAKLKRTVAQAIECGTPLVRLLDGGGHRIQEGQDARHFAQAEGAFQQLADASGWVPIAAAVMGPGFAGPTNHAAMSDFVVMLKGATMGMAGPALVKAGTGEDIDKEELGGYRVQTELHGIADLAVDGPEQALDAIRKFLSYLPSNAQAPLPIVESGDPADRRCEELYDIVPANLRRGYDMRKVIDIIADRGSVFEMKPGFAKNMIAAFARLGGRPVGIIANNPMHLGGMINAAACDKAAHHIAVCDAFGLPLVYLIDVPGFAIGSGAEKTALARRSAKLLHELGNATVPRFSVVLRKGYGLGYYAMCGGRLFEPDAALAWPTAQICAMSVEGAVDVAYRKIYEAAPDPAAKRQELIEQTTMRLGPLRAAEHFGVDDVIDPADTRTRLIRRMEFAPARRNRTRPPKFRSIAPI